MTVHCGASPSPGSLHIPRCPTEISRVMEIHDFRPKTYTAITRCELCDGILLGLVKQGLQCVRCSSNIHRKCLDQILPTSCVGKAHEKLLDFQRTIPIAPFGLTPSNDDGQSRSITSSERSLSTPLPSHRRSLSDQGSISFQSKFPRPVASYSSSSSSELPVPLPKVLGRRNTLTGTLTKSKRKEPLLDRLSQKFEWWQLPKQQQEFILHLGPLCKLEDFILDVICWKNPALSMLVVLGWTIVCMNPHYIVLSPHVIGLYLLNQHYKDHGKHRDDPKKKALSKHDVERRWRWTRNSEILLCELVEQIWALEKRLSWEDDGTMSILKWIFISSVPLAFTARWIPFRLIIWAAGFLLLTVNTALGKTLRESLPEILAERARRQDLAKHQMHKEILSGAATGLAEVIIQIFENQRWWLGKGFVPILHRKERGMWTDETGKITRPSKNEFSPPSGYIWVDEDWVLDFDWSTTPPDPDGWVYSDLHWKNPSSEQGLQSMTRRRMWKRRMRGVGAPMIELPPPPAGDKVEMAGTLGTRRWMDGIPSPENPESYM
jgi:hypothetical protein